MPGTTQSGGNPTTYGANLLTRRRILWNQNRAGGTEALCSCPECDKVSTPTVGRRQTDDFRNGTTTRRNPAKSRSFLDDRAREIDDVTPTTIV